MRAIFSLATTMSIALVFPMISSSFAAFGSGDDDYTWWVGKGTTANMYVKYQIQDRNTGDGRPFNMTIYFERQEGPNQWLSLAWIEGQNNNGSMVINGELLLGDNLSVMNQNSSSFAIPSQMQPYLKGYADSLQWLSAFTPQNQPKSLVGPYKWGKLNCVGCADIEPIGNEIIPTPAGSFNTTILAYEDHGVTSKIWVNKDFPYPIKALAYVPGVFGIFPPPVQFSFELKATGTGRLPAAVAIPQSQKSVMVLPPDNNGSDSYVCHVSVNPTTGVVYLTSTDGSLRMMKEEEQTNGLAGNLTLSQIASIKLPRGTCSQKIAINPRTNTVYVADAINDTLYAINGENLSLIGQIPLLKSQQSNFTFPFGPDDFSIAVDSRTNLVYVNYAIRTASALDGGGTSYGLEYKTSVIDAGNNNSSNSNNKILIDNMSNVGAGGALIAIDEKRNVIAFSHSDLYNRNSSITFAKPLSLAAIPPSASSNQTHAGLSYSMAIDNIIYNLHGEIHSMALNPSTGKLYVDVYNFTRNELYVIDDSTGKLIDVITLTDGTEPDINPVPSMGGTWMDISVNSNTNTIYVTNMLLAKLYVIDGSTDKVTNSIFTPIDSSQLSFPFSAFTGPVEVAANPTSDIVYVRHANSLALSYFEGSQIAVPEFKSIFILPLGIAAIVAVFCVRRIRGKLMQQWFH